MLDFFFFFFFLVGLNFLKTKNTIRFADMNSTADPLHVPEGPITRSKVKKIQEAYTLHLQKLASVAVETKTFEPKNLYSISISNQEDNGVADVNGSHLISDLAI